MWSRRISGNTSKTCLSTYSNAAKVKKSDMIFPVLPGPKLWINTVLINRIFALIYRLLTLQILQVVAPLRFSGRCATTAELYVQSTPKAVPGFQERKLKLLPRMLFHTEQKVWLGSPTVLTVRYIPFLPNILMKRK